MTKANNYASVDNTAFLAARQIAMDGISESAGIGTLAEKLLHRTLKLYFEPNEENHEIECLGSIADIKNSDGIIEIQTRAFDRLRPKLEKFLPECPVTVVYPIIKEKTILWLDKDSGEVSSARKSPRRGLPSDALAELSKIKSMIGHESLTVLIVFLNAEEYRSLDGWDTERKRGATKLERIPTEMIEIIELKGVEDYKLLIPEKLPNEFSAKDFNRVAKLRARRASFSLKLLLDLGLLTRRHGEGRAYVYSRT